MNGMPRAHGCAGAACVSFAQCLSISMGAKVVQCLISGHAVNPSMGARTRLPVSYGPETRHHTPSATWVILVLRFQIDGYGQA